MLVKDYVNRIDWKEIFEYTISESGDIFPPSQMGLRQSYKQQIPNDSHNNSGIVMAPGQNGNNANPNKSNNSGNNVNNGSNVSNGHSTNNGSNANSVNSANQGNPQAFGNNYSSPPSIYSYQNNSAVSSSPIN